MTCLSIHTYVIVALVLVSAINDNKVKVKCPPFTETNGPL